MELLELAIEGYRWLVGVVLLVVVWRVLKTVFTNPFVDEFEQPDYMIKVYGRHVK